MVRRRLSLKETTSTFMLNLQNHRQCPAGGFLLLAGRRSLAGSETRSKPAAVSGSGIGRTWTAARAGAEIPHRGSPAGRRPPVRQAPNHGSSPATLGARPSPWATDRVTATPQCLRKRSAFGNLMAALFICCGAGTYFVHLSFRV